MIEIDGSQGEGGGQILRSSLALAICTQQPFRIHDIRANRETPGLMRQHLTAVKAAARICDAEVLGGDLGSRELTFRPRALQPADYSFDIGTAGSCTLVLQTVLLPLLLASGPSSVRVTGGTHNRGSPPADFFQRVFLATLNRMGADAQLEIRRYGFYPRGGGELLVSVHPSRLASLELQQRGAHVRAHAEAYVAALPLDVAHRELEVVRKRLKLSEEALLVQGLPNDMGPGNAITITIEHEHVTEVFTGFGERGVRAEDVAAAAAREASTYLAATAPVGEHLADQLLLPMALGEGGAFVTMAVTEHLRSNALVIERFTDRKISIEPEGQSYCVTVR